MLTVLLLLSGFELTSSAPVVSSSTESDRAPLVSSAHALPDCIGVARCRSIQSIVWSCVVTIFACTWVAVHPNLPGPGDPGSTRWKRKLLTMMYAMVAPEFVTVWALRQRIAANKIVKEMNGGHEEGIILKLLRAVKEWWSQDPREAPREWTLTHGFFVQMGGFILYDGDMAKRVLTFDDLKRMKERGDQQEWGDGLGQPQGYEEEQRQLREWERELERQLGLARGRKMELEEGLENLGGLELTLKGVQREEWDQVRVVERARVRAEMLRKRHMQEQEPGLGQARKLSRSKWELKRELKRKLGFERKLDKLQERLQELERERESWKLKHQVQEVRELEQQVRWVRKRERELGLKLERRQRQLREMKKQKEGWTQKRASEWGHRTKSGLAREWEQEWNRRKREKLAVTVDADWPTISEHELDDKAKGDLPTKLLVIVQMSWFITQFSARRKAGLLVTELEIITLAFATLNIITYILWWNKPKDVLVAVRVQQRSGSDGDWGEAGPSTNTQSAGAGVREREGALGEKRWLTRKLEEMKESEGQVWLKMVVYRLVQAALRPIGKMRGYCSEIHPGSLRVPMFHTDSRGGNVYFSLLLIAVGFGAVHLIPWSFVFPSIAERSLWRLSALLLILVPVMVYLRDLALHHNEYHPTKYSRFLVGATTNLASLGLPIYILARLTLFILAFTVLRDPLPSVYTNVEWTTFLPHI